MTDQAKPIRIHVLPSMSVGDKRAAFIGPASVDFASLMRLLTCGLFVTLSNMRNFGRRSAIEPVIGHLKKDFRLARNYLKGTIGDAVNLLLAAAAFNCRKWMNAVAEGLLFILCLLRPQIRKDERTLLNYT